MQDRGFTPYIPDSAEGEAEVLAEALASEPPVSVRINPFKAAIPDIISGAEVPCKIAGAEVPDKIARAAVSGRIAGTKAADKIAGAEVSDKIAGTAISGKVPWCPYGYYLAERPSFTFDPLFHAGQYYVQEASSMFTEHILRNLFGDCLHGSPFDDSVSNGNDTLDLSKIEFSDVLGGKKEGRCGERSLRLLDLCAAPGGKTTLYSSLTGPGSVVVANEVIRARAGVLADNVRKWGLGNVVVTNNDPAHFASLREWFDVVAVDAPCSGEGMFRKNPEAREEWSAESVKMCASRQRRILADAWECLRPGGVMIYSTCTFNRTENEDNIEWLTENFECEDAGIWVPDEWNIVQTEAGGIKCFRFYPHRVAGEGLFVAAIRKGAQNDSLPAAETDGGVSKSHAVSKSRPSTTKPRKSLFSDASKVEAAELARWVVNPETMHFAKIGENFYGYHKDAFRDIKTVSESLNAIHSGVCMGQIFGGSLKPDHSLAMFRSLNFDRAPHAGASAPMHPELHATHTGSLLSESNLPVPRIGSPLSEPDFPVPCAELSLPEAIKFLQREELYDISVLAEGLNLITFSGAPLGWAKRIGNRANNLYPKQLAIQSRKFI